jgi:hypothetical protein
MMVVMMMMMMMMMMMIVERPWNENLREKSKYVDKACYGAASSTTDPT